MATTEKARKTKKDRTEVPADKARQSFGDLLDRAAFRGERIVITRQFKGAVAALVSIADLEKIEAA